MTAPADEAWKNYRDAIDRARSPATEGLERSSGMSGEASDLDRVVEASAQLREELAAAALTARPSDIQDLANMKLMAAAAYDLGLAKDLFDKDKGGVSTTEAERSGVAVLADPVLREILDAPLQEGIKSFQTERSAGPPDANAARAGLGKRTETVIGGITDRSAKTVMFAGTAVGNFGFGPAQEWLSALTQEAFSKLSEGLSTFVRYAVRLVREAVLKLWNAFGKDKQKEIQTEAQSWFEAAVGKPESIVTGLLKRVYGADTLHTELAAEIAGKPQSTTAERWNIATSDLDELLARYEKSCTALEWVVRGIGWAKAALLAVPPWGPAAAYAIYVGTIGYAIYSANEYLDARGGDARWLDQVRGVRAIIKEI